MTTPARPGQFTGATDNAANGGLFTDTLIDGIPDIVGADVLAAETAATNAKASETAAATSATNASTSETNAATSATASATSATASANSATAAANSASTTAADAATATTKAAEASTSATNAATSQTAAANSATSAASSATSATGSANSATTSATASASSATAAASSATSASAAATAAQTAQTAAETAETNAETAETNAETAETNAASSATAAASSATAAATSATAASQSATSSATSATNALTSENSAQTYASNALTYSSNASTSETNAAASATAAAASEAAAAGYVDNFDDKYLGAKTSDPTVDNDGDPLTDGALYYNTTDNRMKVYDLGTTTWLFLAPTDAEITNINTVANDITNVNTVATNITDVNSFADTYFISATAPGSPTTGDLWFDTANSIMKVYDGSGFVNAGSSVNGTSARYNYTATAGQTTFAAVYDTGYVDVYLNGVKLAPADFTATNGSTIVLTTGAALNDTVDIVGYGTFSVASAIALPDNVKATFGDSADLQIYHNASHSYIDEQSGTGNLIIRGANVVIDDDSNQRMATFTDGGYVGLRYNGSEKLATTNTGVDVTGTVAATAFTGDGSSLTGIPTPTLTSLGIANHDDITVDGSGKVGIGTASPSKTLTVHGSDGTPLQLQGSGNDTAITFAHSGTINSAINSSSDGAIEFRIGGSSATDEAMRINSSGSLLVGKTSDTLTTEGHVLGHSGYLHTTKSGGAVHILNRTTNDGIIAQYRRDNTAVGSVSVTASGATYNTASDIRLKTDIKPIADATDKLMAMNAVTHKWKADPDADAVVGFIAQEMTEIVPEAVSKGEGEDDMWSMDYGRITPVLVAALQESNKKIEQLEARIAELEAK